MLSEREELRSLGRTGAEVLPVSLGGEGILRTTGRAREAVPVILEALRLGVRYCDTATPRRPTDARPPDSSGAARCARYCTSKAYLQIGIHPFIGSFVQNTVCPPGECGFDPTIAIWCPTV